MQRFTLKTMALFVGLFQGLKTSRLFRVSRDICSNLDSSLTKLTGGAELLLSEGKPGPRGFLFFFNVKLAHRPR